MKTLLSLSILLLSLIKPVYAGHRKVVVSWYSSPQMTASGKVFNPFHLTAASKSLPFGTRVLVVNPKTRRGVVVVVTDRGPYTRGRGLDVSYRAARELGIVKKGVARLDYVVLGK